MTPTIEVLNEAKRQLLALNKGVEGPPLIKSVTLVLGDEGFRLDVIRDHRYSVDAVPTRVLGIPVNQTPDWG